MGLELFRQDEDFMVTLWRWEGVTVGNEGRNGELKGELNGQLNDSQKETLEFIKVHEGFNTTKIVEATG